MMKYVLRVVNNMGKDFVGYYKMMLSHEITALGIFFRSLVSDSKTSLPDCYYTECRAAQFRWA